MAEQSCGTCRYYDGMKMCRRYPPPKEATEREDEYDPHISKHGSFPQVDERDWCGEWQKR